MCIGLYSRGEVASWGVGVKDSRWTEQRLTPCLDVVLLKNRGIKKLQFQNKGSAKIKVQKKKRDLDWSL